MQSLSKTNSLFYGNHFMVFISGESKNCDKTIQLKSCLKSLDLPFTDCLGKYQGTEEKSFCIHLNKSDLFKYIFILINISLNFDQECILIVNDKNECSFIYDYKHTFNSYRKNHNHFIIGEKLNGKFKLLKSWLPNDDWTKMNNNYYSIR